MNHGQSFGMSVLEVVTATAVKFVAAMSVWQWVVSPIFKFDVPVESNFYITCIFATTGIVISTIWRRIFNYFTSEW